MKNKIRVINETVSGFGAFMIVAMIAGSIFDGFEFHYGYQALLVVVVSSLLRYVAYGEDIIKGKTYLFRNILFMTTFFPILFVIAWMGNWFPKSIGPMITFVIIFLIIAISISTYFYFKLKKEGTYYDDKLKEYKQSIQ